jgi:MFS family permease
MLDGMDSFVYALVIVPSLRDLLPRSGIAATKENIGFYGGLLFAIFLFGWDLAYVWGPVGDKFGRVRTLMFTILWYSTFTLLSAFVVNVWQLAILRLLAGIGIGGGWATGGTFVAEEWPENWRIRGAGYICTPASTSAFCWPRSPVSASEAVAAGAKCFCSADCLRCCSHGSVMASLNQRAGNRKKK